MLDDTSPEAHELQMAIYRRMGGSQRVAMMFQMSEEAREITLAGLRRQHPELDERAVRRIEATRRLGAELVDAAWPVLRS
ncbi:hypothetical protein L6R46_24540 [Myxococcota bacterium]|nr:hypothetical protein [Myxococcota bacterium]